MRAAPTTETPPALSIVGDYPESWKKLDDLPLLASERWMRSVGQRIEGDPFWATLETAGRVKAGLAGVLVRDPDAYTFGNCPRLLLDPASPFVDDPELARRLSTPSAPAAGVSLFPNLVVTHPGYSSFAIGENRSDPNTLRHLIDGIAGWAYDRGATLLAFLYVDAREDLLARVLAESGFHRVTFTADAELPVPKDGFPSYLASLPSRRRRRIRLDRDRMSRAKLVSRTLAMTDALIEEMARLRGLQRAKYGLPVELSAERDRLLRLRSHLADSTTVIGIEDERSALVSFTLFVRDRKAWHALYTGTDYAHPAHSCAYFEATFYRALEIAATVGITAIFYGIGAEQAKRRRSCRLSPISAWLKSKTPQLDQALADAAAAWSLRRPIALDQPP